MWFYKIMYEEVNLFIFCCLLNFDLNKIKLNIKLVFDFNW